MIKTDAFCRQFDNLRIRKHILFTDIYFSNKVKVANLPMVNEFLLNKNSRQLYINYIILVHLTL